MIFFTSHHLPISINDELDLSRNQSPTFVQLTLTPNSGAAGDDVLRAVAELHNHYAVTVAECPKLDFLAATDLDCIWSKSALEISR